MLAPVSCRFTAAATLLAIAPLLGQAPDSAQARVDPITAALARARPSPREDAWRLIPWQRSLVGAGVLLDLEDDSIEGERDEKLLAYELGAELRR